MQLSAVDVSVPASKESDPDVTLPDMSRSPIRYAVQVGDRRLVSDLDTVELVSAAMTIPHSIDLEALPRRGYVEVILDGYRP